MERMRNLKGKKTAAVLLAALLSILFSLSASAKEWQGSDFTFTVPEEFTYIFGPETSEDDPSWALAGIGDPAAMLQEYQQTGIVADLYGENGAILKVTQRTNSSVQDIFTLRGMSEEELSKFLEELSQVQNGVAADIQVTKSYIEVDGQPFYRHQIDGRDETGEAHEVQYGTIVNGKVIAFITYIEGAPLPQEWVSLLDSAVRSVKFTQILEKPEPEPVNVALMLTLLILLVAIIVAPLIYMPIRNRREKKEKAKMAERLAEYRKDHPGDTLSGPPLFVNETDCTREAVHAFSIYHAYGKNLPSLIAGLLLCAVLVAAVFLFDLTWWLKALAVGVTVYYLYRAANMANTIEKVQRKVFSRGVSSTARYTFYEDGFRVTGIQSASTFPYFQITAVRRRGHYLYLYYSSDNAYLVDEYGFSFGEFEDFRKFIGEKAGK